MSNFDRPANGRAIIISALITAVSYVAAEWLQEDGFFEEDATQVITAQAVVITELQEQLLDSNRYFVEIFEDRVDLLSDPRAEITPEQRQRFERMQAFTDWFGGTVTQTPSSPPDR